MKLVVALAFIGAVSAYKLHDDVSRAAVNFTGTALRDYINNAQSLFKAKVPTTTYRGRLMGHKYTKLPHDAVFKTDAPDSAPLPENFDSRTKWPACTSIGAIRDQSHCGSSWAFAAAEVMSDRVCIASNGSQQPTLSAEDLLTCCRGSCSDGCDGGYPLRSWVYMYENGICTGGGFESHAGCKPYSIEPCGDHTAQGEFECRFRKTPACVVRCTNQGYPIKYDDDMYFGKSAYAVRNNVESIKQEMYDHGPVEAVFEVYEDFEMYGEGIYKHVWGEVLGGQAVKIIGWGTEDGTAYWLVANSWSVEWGEKGFFRLLAGTNECGIEGAVVAGQPRL